MFDNVDMPEGGDILKQNTQNLDPLFLHSSIVYEKKSVLG